MRRLFLALILLALPSLAAAQELTACTTSVAGETLQLHYDAGNEAIGRNRSYREQVLGGRGEITCPAFVTLRYLTPELSDAERDPFCLVWDDDARTYSGFSQGRRDAWLGCRTSTSLCERVNRSRDAALAIAGLRDEAAEEGATDGLAGAVRALSDRSGAVVLAGTSSYVSSALSSLGAAVTATLGAPVAAAAATVTLVAVGGAVYVCSE